jgi:thiol-disulfide isomerase/thioredoxin
MKDELATLAEIAPSWLGVHFRAVPPAVRTAHGLPSGANLLDAVYPDSPALEAGLQVGDIVLGPPGQPFGSPNELREWTMTSPRGVPLPLVAVRPADDRSADETFEATLVLRTVPFDLPKLPTPAVVGERAPVLPGGLRPVGPSERPDMKGRAHLLFFWATWCGPCKKAVPEVLAFAEKKGLPVVAISDEDEETVKGFLAARTEAFFPEVVVDPMRKTFISYGVSGTPTLLLVDAEGVIQHRQVGYTPEKGLTIAGWSWAAR